MIGSLRKYKFIVNKFHGTYQLPFDKITILFKEILWYFYKLYITGQDWMHSNGAVFTW